MSYTQHSDVTRQNGDLPNAGSGLSSYARIMDCLGTALPDARHGLSPETHRSSGTVGTFRNHTICTVVAAQSFEASRRDHLSTRATGRALDPDLNIAYCTGNYSGVGL